MGRLFAQRSARTRPHNQRFHPGGKRAWRLVSTGLRARLGGAENDTPAIGSEIQTHVSLCHLAAWISEPNPSSIFEYPARPKANYPETNSRFLLKKVP